MSHEGKQHLRVLLDHATASLGLARWTLSTEADGHHLLFVGGSEAALSLAARLCKNEVLMMAIREHSYGEQTWISHKATDKEEAVPILLVANGKVSVVVAEKTSQANLATSSQTFADWFQKLTGQTFPLPSVAKLMRRKTPWCWGTANVRPKRLVGFPHCFFDSGLDGKAHTVVAIAGYGTNSYAFYFTWIDGPDREIFLRIPFGNFYSDPDEEKRKIVDLLRKVDRERRRYHRTRKAYRLVFNMGDWRERVVKPFAATASLRGKIGRGSGRRKTIDFRLDPRDGSRWGIGRFVDQDIILDDSAASRQHAEIRCKEGRKTAKRTFSIRDVGSTNGTFVNGKKLPPGESRLLKNGDQIRVGSTDLSFHLRSPNPTKLNLVRQSQRRKHRGK
jgi:hypothetical protein